MYWSYQYLSIEACHALFNAHKPTKDGEIGFQIQIPQPCMQRKFVTRIFHAHSDAHKQPKPLAPTIFMLDTKF